MAGGYGTRLKPITEIYNKHFIQIFDKPMIFYPLSILMLMNIKNVLIITDIKSKSLFLKLLGSGKKFGLKISYKIQKKPNGIPEGISLASKFIGKSKSNILLLGDNFFYGPKLSKDFISAFNKNKGATIFLHSVMNPQDFGNVIFDKKGNIRNVREKLKKNKNDLAITGLYFFNNKVVKLVKNLKPSSRGELEITDLLRQYLYSKELSYKILRRGYKWFDMGTSHNIFKVNKFVGLMQEKQKLMIGNIHEIAYIKKFIKKSQFKNIIFGPDSMYFKFLRRKYFK